MTIRTKIKKLKARAWKLFLSEEPAHLVTQAGIIMVALLASTLFQQDLPEGFTSLFMVVTWLGAPWLYLDLRIMVRRKHKDDLQRLRREIFDEQLRDVVRSSRTRSEAESRAARLHRKLAERAERDGDTHEAEIVRARLNEMERCQLSPNELRAIYRALVQGAESDGEDVSGLLLKGSGHMLLDDEALNALVRKLREMDAS